MGEVADKHYDSRQDKLKNSMNTTELTNTNIFKIIKFYFRWKTDSLVSDDFYILSVFVGANGEDEKNIKNAESLIDHFYCKYLNFYQSYDF